MKNLNEFYKLAGSAAASRDDDKDLEADEDDADEMEGGGGGGYALDNMVSVRVDRLPPPTAFGGGNPFLMFMCLACILQHR